MALASYLDALVAIGQFICLLIILPNLQELIFTH